jgi:DNA-binding transcriptional MerR regulator
MSSAHATAAQLRGKSPEAFRTISEVSFELDVPQHVLRFWETRFSQLRPVKRAGGRRFYRPEDVMLLRGIRSLLYADGYTIKGVQKVLRDKGWRHVAEIGRAVSGAVPWTEIGDADDARAVDTIAPLPAPETLELNTGSSTAIAALLRAHADAAEKVAMEEHKRVKLELLLAELLVLRDRLRSVRRLRV